MPGIQYSLDLDAASFKQGAAQSMDYINQLHGRIDKLSSAGGGGNGFLKGLSTTLFQLPQQVMALQGIMSTLALPSKLAASAETTAVAFRVLVGDTAKADAALGRIRKMAETTPFEFPELADASRKLIAFGESSETVAETLRRIGDVSSGISAPISEIAELYGKARVQGTLFAEDINQLTGRGVPIIQEFAKQLGVTEGAVKKLASEGQVTFPMLERAFADMTSGAGKFSGMMDTASRTMEGRLSTLGDSFKGIMVNVGEGLNEALKPLVTDASGTLDGMKEKAAEVGKALGMGISGAKIAFEQGKIGELIVEGFKAGGLFVADTLVKALSWGAEYLKAQWLQFGPGSGAEEKQAGQEYEANLKSEGLNMPGLGVTALSDASKEASRELGVTVKLIKQDAQSTQNLAKSEELRRQSAMEQQRRAIAQREAAAAQNRPAAPTVSAPILPPPVILTEPQGPGLPTPNPLPIPREAGEEFRIREQMRNSVPDLSAAMDPAARGRKNYGTHRIRGAGFRGAPRLKLSAAERRTMMGGGPSPEALGQVTGRGQERSRKMSASAAAEMEKQQKGSAAGTMEQTVREIAKNVEILAKNLTNDEAK